jgi:hypothetical protein
VSALARVIGGCRTYHHQPRDQQLLRYESTAVKLEALIKTYDSRGDECSVVHHGVTGKPFDSAIEKVIDPERHRIDQDENRQLDADQDGEKVLKRNHVKRCG